MDRFLMVGGFLLDAAWLVPVAAKAEDHQSGHDRHTWNHQEDGAYRVYLGEQHRPHVEFPKVKVAQQTEYFKWRPQHPDSSLVKVEVK